ncbi:MAG: YtxH domain-containing protein [Lentimicrobiaceae bacterium]|jgi:gas vesicle protein|nr:YtxH domain-containing protein [Lentimicrobiaceae bacterium]
MRNPFLTFVAGLLAGAATGIIIGTLYAPQKGSKTRRQIRQKVNELQEKVVESVDDLQDQISDKINDVHHKVTQKVNDLKQCVEAIEEDDVNAKAKMKQKSHKNYNK